MLPRARRRGAPGERVVAVCEDGNAPPGDAELGASVRGDIPAGTRTPSASISSVASEG